MLSKKLAAIDKTRCVACGVCENTCPIGAVKVRRGCYAAVEAERCVGCGKCEALSRGLHRGESEGRGMKKAKHWYDYLWVYAIIYFALGFFQYPVCMAGHDRFSSAAVLSHLWREQIFLQPPLRTGSTVQQAGN